MTTALIRRAEAPAWSPTAAAGGRARMGPRLRAILELCPDEGAVADVGSGHGRLAAEIKRRWPQRQVYATEVHPGPSAELRRLLGATSGVEILEGEGLAPLAEHPCRGVVIAGLGGSSIARMLQRDRELAQQLSWLCLQPAQRSERLAQWLEAAGWTWLERRRVVEKGHLYQLFLVAPR
ncbi:MAG: tRNA (adenine(22)-N(1))-methyltransferase TrmK [Candidatus Dormiibacterota bacterium]|jgi:tRNA (adenine22-N1)-methyltransferase